MTIEFHIEHDGDAVQPLVSHSIATVQKDITTVIQAGATLIEIRINRE